MLDRAPPLAELGACYDFVYSLRFCGRWRRMPDRRVWFE